MTARIVAHGRVVYADAAYRAELKRSRLAQLAVPRDKRGDILKAGGHINPRSAAAPFRAGVPFEDREERVVYRRVTSLDPRDGWATTAFWQARWSVRHDTVIELVARGLLDAAMEEGSQVRKYRCRDEGAVRREPAFLAALERMRRPPARRAR